MSHRLRTTALYLGCMVYTKVLSEAVVLEQGSRSSAFSLQFLLLNDSAFFDVSTFQVESFLQGTIPDISGQSAKFSYQLHLPCLLNLNSFVSFPALNYVFFHEVPAPLATVSLWTWMRAVSSVMIATQQSAILSWFVFLPPNS